MAKKKPSRGLKIQDIQPKTDSQQSVFDSFDDNYNLVLTGCAGTGKTFLALYLALDEVLRGHSGRDHVKLFRSAVSTRDMGYAPGTVKEKLSVYEGPYPAIVNELFDCGTAYDSLSQKHILQFMSTSYNRGITIDDAVIIVDECQNLTTHEIRTIITRMGQNSRIILCGDCQQVDLDERREQSGFGTFIKVAERMPEDFDIIRFTTDDIVRHAMIKRYLKACIDLGV